MVAAQLQQQVVEHQFAQRRGQAGAFVRRQGEAAHALLQVVEIHPVRAAEPGGGEPVLMLLPSQRQPGVERLPGPGPRQQGGEVAHLVLDQLAQLGVGGVAEARAGFRLAQEEVVQRGAEEGGVGQRRVLLEVVPCQLGRIEIDPLRQQRGKVGKRGSG